MIQRKWLQPILFSLGVAAAFLVGGAQATGGPALKTVKIQGKRRIAWDVRLGTVRGILDLKQSGSQLTGTFFEEFNGETYSLSGDIQGEDIAFEVTFPKGSRPFTPNSGSARLDRDHSTPVYGFSRERLCFRSVMYHSLETWMVILPSSPTMARIIPLVLNTAAASPWRSRPITPPSPC
jgi:hypothetical protein